MAESAPLTGTIYTLSFIKQIKFLRMMNQAFCEAGFNTPVADEWCLSCN